MPDNQRKDDFHTNQKTYLALVGIVKFLFNNVSAFHLSLDPIKSFADPKGLKIVICGSERDLRHFQEYVQEQEKKYNLPELLHTKAEEVPNGGHCVVDLEPCLPDLKALYKLNEADAKRLSLRQAGASVIAALCVPFLGMASKQFYAKSQEVWGQPNNGENNSWKATTYGVGSVAAAAAAVGSVPMTAKYGRNAVETYAVADSEAPISGAFTKLSIARRLFQGVSLIYPAEAEEQADVSMDKRYMDVCDDFLDQLNARIITHANDINIDAIEWPAAKRAL